MAMLVIAILALLALRRGRIRGAIFGYAFFSWMLLAIHFHLLLPLQSQLQSPRQAAEFIARSVPDEAPLFGHGDAYQRSMHWYLKRNFEKKSMAELIDLASKNPYAWVFIMHREPLSGDLLASRPYCQWRSPKFIITFFPATEGDEKLSCDDGKSGS